jgi:hypothetical protein
VFAHAMHVDEDDNKMDFEDYGKYVKINGTTYIFYRLQADCEYPRECVRHEVICKNGLYYVQAQDPDGHIIVFSYATINGFAGETVYQRAKNLRAGDEVYAKQKFCPVIGCRLRKTHVANEQCVFVKKVIKPIKDDMERLPVRTQETIVINFGIPLRCNLVVQDEEVQNVTQVNDEASDLQKVPATTPTHKTSTKDGLLHPSLPANDTWVRSTYEKDNEIATAEQHYHLGSPATHINSLAHRSKRRYYAYAKWKNGKSFRCVTSPTQEYNGYYANNFF